ncbi:uncharacterized protein FIBRA_06673 [Fibroporia radiculosa]|uniref:Uncharacterized protein n=1 Tax=Fibroporia radiculosa TaxID=599839 RepID=J4GC67_9APHY|nr:uncharacterized protein FIBRA_06673 [Fibroporia radiculosa]CCM04493.1 predicted protein [Fibroporia radiculosa]
MNKLKRPHPPAQNNGPSKPPLQSAIHATSYSLPESRTMMYARAVVPAPTVKVTTTVPPIPAISAAARPSSVTEQYWAARALTAETLLSARIAHQTEILELATSAEEKRSQELLALRRTHDERHARLEMLVVALIACLVAFVCAIMYMHVRSLDQRASRWSVPTHFTIPILSPFASVVEHETSVIGNRLLAVGAAIFAILAYACFRFWLSHKIGSVVPGALVEGRQVKACRSCGVRLQDLADIPPRSPFEFCRKSAWCNPLAIIDVPSTVSLTDTQKHHISREFNLSETVFIHHPPTHEAVDTIRVSIWTTEQELPFAGHPSIGAAWYLLTPRVGSGSTGNVMLNIPAGLLAATYSSPNDLASVVVPHDVKIHSPYVHTGKMAEWLGLTPADLALEDASKGVPLVSIVKGMTFLLVRVNDLEALGRIHAVGERFVVNDGVDRDESRAWLVGSFVGVYCYVLESEIDRTQRLRTRMLEGTFEDPATGSAACTLSVYLANGIGSTTFEIVQGVEMGRRSEIMVEVTRTDARIEEVRLAGRAVKVMAGSLDV